MVIIVNKKAKFNYEIIEDFEVGIVLMGSEVKSLRDKKVSLVDSYATIRKNEVFLTNCRIEPYKQATIFNHEPTRSRKLLLKRKEIDRIVGKMNQRGWVLVPLKMYFNEKSKVKVQLGLGRGKKQFDKRQVIKERDIKREMDREMKSYR